MIIKEYSNFRINNPEEHFFAIFCFFTEDLEELVLYSNKHLIFMLSLKQICKLLKIQNEKSCNNWFGNSGFGFGS